MWPANPEIFTLPTLAFKKVTFCNQTNIEHTHTQIKIVHFNNSSCIGISMYQALTKPFPPLFMKFSQQNHERGSVIIILQIIQRDEITCP